ncbi:TspO/MBR family protein [Methylocystis suflitae]|uniref:TspO/MBR family protein n=1 Tax=Methylocystis suflitae TaxID=2951405 RepID=UPI00210A5FD3|nr:TspO/MBR family protein [Methylocystis suflitae]MCQ4191627.1 tryptophan-rich sensory protein [Methylocystis suflitae]
MSSSTSLWGPPSRLVAGTAAAAPVLAAALLGSFATTPNIPWHETLAKPPLTPPNWVFGPVWTALYILMAYAFYRVLRLEPATPGRRAAIIVFLAQLVLNGAWSFAFFDARSAMLGLIVILPMAFLLAVTIILFWRIDRVAGYSLAPTAVWVAFATYLNAGIFILDR